MSDQDDFDGPAITRGRPPERQSAPPKKGLNPMKLAAVTVAVVLVALAWAFRWEVTPAEGGASTQSRAYLLDRWTGTLYFVAGSGKYTVKLDD
jgi:hypothetical protein